MAAVYTRLLRALWRLGAGTACVLLILAATSTAAQAHTTGPQLVSHIDTITPQAPGLSYSLLSTGSAPYVTVGLSGNHTVEIYGLLGEPFIRLSSAGVDLNHNSPSLYLISDPTRKVTLPATVPGNPDWRHESDATTYHYYETRAEWPYLGQPQEAKAIGRTTTVYRFRIPASDDGTTVTISGHVTWIPAPINLEVPLLFVPIAVVIVLWVEPKAKPHLAALRRAVVWSTGAGVVVAALRTAVALDGGRAAAGAARLAPLAAVPGLVLLAALAIPRVGRGQRAAYTWTMLFGLYLLVFGLVRVDTAAWPLPGLTAWLRHLEALVGLVVTLGGGLLLFLSSPVRQTAARGRRGNPARGHRGPGQSLPKELGQRRRGGAT